MKNLTKGKRETAEILLGMKEDRRFTSIIVGIIFAFFITILAFLSPILGIIIVFPYYFFIVRDIYKLNREIQEIREILKQGKLLYGWNFRE